MSNKRKFITPEEAISLLKKSSQIHTFRNTGNILIGCDWRKKEVIKTLKANPDKIEIGGEQCRSMGHGLVVDSGGYLFIETDDKALNKFDPL